MQTGQLASTYGVLDERGIRSPNFLSIKFNIFAWISALHPFIHIDNPPTLTGGDGATTATPWQRFVFGTLPDVYVPQWLFKLLAGNPETMQWPLATTSVSDVAGGIGTLLGVVMFGMLVVVRLFWGCTGNSDPVARAPNAAGQLGTA